MFMADMDYEHAPSDREMDERDARDIERFYYVRGPLRYPIPEWCSREWDHGMRFDK